MTWERIANVIRKEWAVMISSPSNALFLLVIPLVLVGQAIFLAWIVPRFVSADIVGAGAPGGAGLDSVSGFRVLILSQFHFFVLLIPAMVANVFATQSIVEEKVTRTLEPLLATPVRTWELLLGKILSGAVPAVAAAWGSAGIFVLLVFVLGWGELMSYVIGASWYLSVFLLTPAVALLSFVVGVIGSSRASDPKSAQNLAVFVALPIFLLIGVQVTGLVWFTPLLTLLLSLGIVVLDVWLVLLAARLFGRESIVVRWR